MATSTRLTSGSELLDAVDTFVFDCDGVIWTGTKMIEEADAVLAELARSAHSSPLPFVNTFRKSRLEPPCQHSRAITVPKHPRTITRMHLRTLRRTRVRTDTHPCPRCHPPTAIRLHRSSAPQVSHFCTRPHDHTCTQHNHSHTQPNVYTYTHLHVNHQPPTSVLRCGGTRGRGGGGRHTRTSSQGNPYSHRPSWRTGRRAAVSRTGLRRVPAHHHSHASLNISFDAASLTVCFCMLDVHA
jgi:hypothetical protein